LIPNPIQRVLSTLSTHDVRCLLMGGQACVLYGGAEFSRDCDIAILCNEPNLSRLQSALKELDAENIAVPPLEAAHLERGHAVHFRCHAAEAENVRIDVMAKLRGVAPFAELWSRRTTIEDDRGNRMEVLALPDLVAAKKTQRDKDWPMLRRLVEANYAQHAASATEEQLRFWLSESRTPQMLLDLAARAPALANELLAQRPLLQHAIQSDLREIRTALADEQSREREADRLYWEPLKRELETMRRAQRNRRKS
jgi:hypothetical protein